MLDIFLFLFFCLGIVGASYVSLYVPLLYLSNEFKEKNYNKRLYIVKNIIKSIILSLITIDITSNILRCEKICYNIDQNDVVFDNNYMKSFASLYVSNDLFALFVVPKLPRTTLIHHITSTLFLFYIYFIDFNDNTDIGKGIFLYTYLSMASYIVNFVLAVRSFKNFPYLQLLQKIAYYVYLVCIITNWGGHILLYLYKLVNMTINIKQFIYILVILPLINDDLILLSWLKTKSKKQKYEIKNL